MKEQIPFHDLICMSCRSAADGERLPSLDYAIAEIVVEMNDGTQVTVPIDITEFDVEYQSAGRSSARVLARVPCPSCQSSHRIDISAVRRAPFLEPAADTVPELRQGGLRDQQRSKDQLSRKISGRCLG